VRKVHRKEAAHFAHWPQQAQADFLAPAGYEAVYRTNAYTRHGEHGNALLSRWPVLSQQHEDISDHRFEQRGLLHVQVQAHGQFLHVIVLHLGLIRASRLRQLQKLRAFIQREVPENAPLVVAGDFNDWGPMVSRPLAELGLQMQSEKRTPTFPSRLPLVQLDHVYARGLRMVEQQVPRGNIWGRMSDHLPLIVDFELSS
jgi:endonuclease/exonuclease/phosphatase family metal-dependent hydrolase